MAGDIQIKYERKIILDTIQFIIHINNLHNLLEKLILIHNTVKKTSFIIFTIVICHLQHTNNGKLYRRYFTEPFTIFGLEVVIKGEKTLKPFIYPYVNTWIKKIKTKELMTQ